MSSGLFLILLKKASLDIILFLGYARSMVMSGQKMRETLDKLDIGQTELARWLGISDRAVRHYVQGKRPVPPSLALLLEYLADRPEAKQWFVERVQEGK